MCKILCVIWCEYIIIFRLMNINLYSYIFNLVKDYQAVLYIFYIFASAERL